MDQRYISGELTHFVGGDKEVSDKYSSDQECFELLVTILKSGVLKAPPLSTDPAVEITAQTVVSGTSFSARDMYRSSVVCFCDIPLADLSLHMNKYSRFGISFTKGTLLPKGVNPVFYLHRIQLSGRSCRPSAMPLGSVRIRWSMHDSIISIVLSMCSTPAEWSSFRGSGEAVKSQMTTRLN